MNQSRMCLHNFRWWQPGTFHKSMIATEKSHKKRRASITSCSIIQQKTSECITLLMPPAQRVILCFGLVRDLIYLCWGDASWIIEFVNPHSVAVTEWLMRHEKCPRNWLWFRGLLLSCDWIIQLKLEEKKQTNWWISLIACNPIIVAWFRFYTSLRMLFLLASFVVSKRTWVERNFFSLAHE